MIWYDLPASVYIGTYIYTIVLYIDSKAIDKKIPNIELAELGKNWTWTELLKLQFFDKEPMLNLDESLAKLQTLNIVLLEMH